jgi:ribosome-associated heat shock protein Hsp15
VTTPPPEGAGPKLRVDKWLWQARFFKTRGLAAEVAGSGKLRVNGSHVTKAAHAVRPGDVLTFPQAARVRVVRIEVLGQRRGPASEAMQLYTDLDPQPLTQAQEPNSEPVPAQRDPGSGRPTGRQRREIDALRRRDP